MGGDVIGRVGTDEICRTEMRLGKTEILSACYQLSIEGFRRSHDPNAPEEDA